MDKLINMILRRTYELDRSTLFELNRTLTEGHLIWWTDKDYSVDFCYKHIMDTVRYNFTWDLVKETNGVFYPNKEMDDLIEEYIETKYRTLIIEKFNQVLNEETHS